MAFKQIKFIRQEEGKGYIFPDTADVIGGGDFQLPDEVFESFSFEVKASIRPKLSAGEGIVNVSALEVGASINTVILRSTDFAANLSLTATASIGDTIIASLEVEDIITIPSAIASISYNITKFDCPPANQLVSTYCSGTTLYGRYTNGSCGTYDAIIETNSTSCGFVPTPTTATPTISDISAGQQTVTFNLRNNDASTATIFYEINDTTPDLYSVSVGAGQTVSRSISGLSSCTSYTLYATAQASGENRSGNAAQGFTTLSTPNGTLLSTYCSGTTKYGVYSNGSCGTYDQIIETNSTDCGYVPPQLPDLNDPQFQGANTGTESITADYYNPNNTNADLTVYLVEGFSFVDSASTGVSAFGTSSVSFQQLTPSTTYTLEAFLSQSGYDSSGVIYNNVTTDASSGGGGGTTQTATPSVNLATSGGNLTISVTNNDASTATMSYSGNATSIFTSLPSSLGAGQTYFASSFAFQGTYSITVTAQASGKTLSNSASDSQTI